MHHRNAILLLSVLTIALGTVACFALTGAFEGEDGDSPEAAQTADALQTMSDATNASLPRATKDIEYTPPSTCPQDFPTPYFTKPDGLHQPPPDFKGSVAGTAWIVGSNGTGYDVAAGQMEPGAGWGVRVRAISPDPCALAASGTPEIGIAWYALGNAPISLVDVQGDVLVLALANSTIAELHVLTGVMTSVATPAATGVQTEPTPALTESQFQEQH